MIGEFLQRIMKSRRPRQSRAPEVLVEALEMRRLLNGGPTPMLAEDTPPAQAVLVKDVNPGLGSSINLPWIGTRTLSEMVAVGSQVFFGADDGKHGFTLWKSDGTAGGTQMVRRNLDHMTDLTSMGGTLYFLRKGQFWRSDGTSQGTVMVKRWSRALDSVSMVGKFQGLLVLEYRSQLWTSDGTLSGTRVLHQGTAEIYGITVGGGRFFFTENPQGGQMPGQLWASDGTPEGTVPRDGDERLSGRS